MKLLSASILCFSLLSLTACKPDEDSLSPAGYDTLAQDIGYWEWQSNQTRGSLLTPATVGFSRQLLFDTNNQLTIYHDGQVYSQVPFQLSVGLRPSCGSPQSAVPLVLYTAEPQIWNDDLKTYWVEVTPTGQTLHLEGAAACVDAGQHEAYVWHAGHAL
ncbi:MAG: hypothetical protein H7Z21_14960 [Hymenobacter sp.]|nr:hypothetical protein [Hymenobacter sp.]